MPWINRSEVIKEVRVNKGLSLLRSEAVFYQDEILISDSPQVITVF